jgi:hypothetical protein
MSRVLPCRPIGGVKKSIDLARISVQRFQMTHGGTMPAIAWHDTVGLSFRFGVAPALLWRLWYSSFEVLCREPRK